MNLEPPRPQPPTIPSSFTSVCSLHPDHPVTGFCASCLRDRLISLDAASRAKPAPTPSSSSSAVLRAFFRGDRSYSKKSFCANTRLRQLRRCESFSGAKADGIAASLGLEPQRKSCDVRVRSTLSSLFHKENGKGTQSPFSNEIEDVEDEEEYNRNNGKSNNDSSSNVRNENKDRPADHAHPTIKEAKGEIEVEEEEKNDEDEDDKEIKVLDTVTNVPKPLAAERGEKEVEESLMAMKDHISLNAQARDQKASTAEKRDLKEIAGGFRLAASVLSKKLHQWRRRKKKREPSPTSARERVSSMPRCFFETQSEFADYGYGRRSCDTDPRFSLDAGRISMDGGRYSFDEPRASWDGNLTGHAPPAPPRTLPLMDSVFEDASAPARRSVSQIPFEQHPLNPIEEHPTATGPSVRATDQCLDLCPSERCRQDLERSGSVLSATSKLDDSASWVSNPKPTPESLDLLTHKIADSEPISACNSLRDDCLESFESAYRDASATAGGGRGLQWKGWKKPRRWVKVWNVWGLLLRRGAGRDESVDVYSRGNVVDRSFSESWPELRREANGANGDFGRTTNGSLLRSNSSASWRSSSMNASFSGHGAGSSWETADQSRKRREEFVLERNPGAGFPPPNGVVSFYLTPLQSSLSESGGDSGKSKSGNSYSFARSILRLY